MRDEDKTKQDLIAELRALRAEVALQNEFAQSNDKSFGQCSMPSMIW